MDNAAAPKTVLETLRTVEFRLGLRGYDVDEVDDYLEKVAIEADALQEQLRQMTDRLRQAAERIALLESQKSAAPAPQVEAEAAETAALSAATAAASTDSLQRTLEMAQRFVDQTRRESEAEAATVIAEANAEARKLQADAEGRYKSDLSRLEGLKTKLTTDVELMARQLESERTRLRSSLSEMIQWIEDNVQPGAAIMALRQNSGSAGEARPTAEAQPAPGPAAAAVEQVGGDAEVLDLRQPGLDD
jgi:cell division initiation protein